MRAAYVRFGAIALLAVSLAAPAALAQDRSLQTLQQTVERLQRDLADMQRQVYGGQAPVGAPAGGANQAQAEVRLTSLENELRKLTGRIEQIDFQMRQLTTRLDKLVGDVDFRLQQLEARAGTAPAVSDAGDDAAPRPSTAAGPVPSPSTPAPAPATTATTPPAATTTALGPRTLPQGTPMQRYDFAFSLLRKSAFAEAAQAFREFVVAHPDDKLAGNAQYWLGETHFVRGQYEEAAVAFVDGYRRYPDSAKATDTLLKLGMTLRRLGQKQEACATFGELDRRFPDANPRLRDRAAQERQAAGCT
ncbi:MAG: tol-pal system protein YbgF [Alphaproteobacteria bacterium]